MHDLMDIEHYYLKGKQALKEQDTEQAVIYFKMAWNKFNNSDTAFIPDKFVDMAREAFESYLDLKSSNHS
ncbi:hypothetical protein E1J38_013380 [Seonamhaeicola sediminis]|uniref:Uncharacterized protein n=1 Tax=Seonamhaeicola sediminis TaxID=2528206 RepID=A0A562YBM7_9FLAO|nr:hypothetical protein [Seonamhaeicola sediminis]TWO31509.1 hypothetical protein E1J38_013380 [Seonamhaeicola sediminis]